MCVSKKMGHVMATQTTRALIGRLGEAVRTDSDGCFCFHIKFSRTKTAVQHPSAPTPSRSARFSAAAVSSVGDKLRENSREGTRREAEIQHYSAVVWYH